MSTKLLTKREAQRLIDYIGGDGHTIFDAAKLIEGTDVPENKLACWIHTHESDTSSPKETIFANDGTVVAEVRGIYGLNLVESIACALDCHSPMQGRGSMCRDLTVQINAKLREADLDTPLMTQEGGA